VRSVVVKGLQPCAEKLENNEETVWELRYVHQMTTTVRKKEAVLVYVIETAINVMKNKIHIITDSKEPSEWHYEGRQYK